MPSLRAAVLVSVILFLTRPVETFSQEGFQLKKQAEIQQVRPQKPVRIKLHRNAKGEYSWDLTGDNVDEVVKADRRLRSLLKSEQSR